MPSKIPNEIPPAHIIEEIKKKEEEEKKRRQEEERRRPSIEIPEIPPSPEKTPEPEKGPAIIIPRAPLAQLVERRYRKP